MQNAEAEFAILKQINIDLSLQNDLLKSELSDLKHNFTLHIFAALDSILQDKRSFFEPGTVAFRLKDGDYFKEVLINPNNLVCVFTPIKGRGKTFILRELYHIHSERSVETFKAYHFNNNAMNYEQIKKLIDPLDRRLVQISKNAIVNVGFYHFESKDLLAFNPQPTEQTGFDRFNITMKGATELFTIIQMNWQENYSLQKRITDYKNGETGSGRP